MTESRQPARRFGLTPRVWSPVERRRRAAARQALYSSLVLVAITGWAGAQWIVRPAMSAREQAWSRIDFAALPEVDLLARYVRIDTGPAGSEVLGAQFLATQLRQAGIESTLDIVDATHANLWAVIEGKSSQAIVLHHHIDVSAADPSRWSFPPFDGLVRAPWIRGRGTFDMKSVAIAQLLAFLDVHARGTKPERSLILLATSAEEQGSATGMQRVIAQHRELVRRIAVLLTEGGAVEARSIDDIKYWGIEFAQRRFVRLRARAPSRERLETLRRALEARAFWETKPRLCAETRAFLAAYGDSRDRSDYQRILSDPERLVADPKIFEEAPPIVRELLVDSFFLEGIQEDPGGFSVPVGLLLLPDTPLAEAVASFMPAQLLDGVTLAEDTVNPISPGSSLEHPAYRAMRRILKERFGSPPVGPYMLSETLSDARFTRALGIPSYGFSPFLLLPIDTYRVDKSDERIGLPGYVAGVAVYRGLVARLVDDSSSWE